jgi:alpha-ribazole phosphatase
MDDHLVIALFRHGLTEENKRKAYLGWNDSPLCPEAKNLKTANTYESYFSSDLGRCVQTGNLLFPNQKFILIEDLREMNFGKWQEKTYEELKEETQYRHWIADPITNCPPEGESFQEFSRRVQKGWDRITGEILSKGIKRSAVITHGGVIKQLLSQFAPEQKDFWDWNVPHGTGIELIFEHEKLRRKDRCTLLREVPITGNEHG